jgi:hypothetical protein
MLSMVEMGLFLERRRRMADKMISISEADAELVKEIQTSLEFPVTIKAVVHKAIVDLHRKLTVGE